MRGLLLGCVVALGLATAAMAGQPITADDLAQFKVGVATPDDVIHKFGKPLSVMKTSDGSETLIYGWTNTHAKAATFVPIVGMFAGGATGQTSSTTFVFGPDHLLMNSSSNVTNVDCSMHGVGMSCGG